jgi:hypothetical protein
MAVTITRTPWIDDDGTGTTGTVLNNAVKTALYNDIDGALAKVPQITGGNTLIGNQGITGQVSATLILINNATNPGNAQLSVVADAAVRNSGVAIQNFNANNTLQFVWMLNNLGSLAGTIVQTGATTVAYNTSSDARLKDDAGRATDLSALRAVVVHDFAWKADGRADRGVFAQDAHAVFPRAISPGTDETTADGHLARPWMTDYSKFVPDLIVGWQHHDAALVTLRARLAELKGLPDAE